MPSSSDLTQTAQTVLLVVPLPKPTKGQKRFAKAVRRVHEYEYFDTAVNRKLLNYGSMIPVRDIIR